MMPTILTGTSCPRHEEKQGKTAEPGPKPVLTEEGPGPKSNTGVIARMDI
ncbi:hypothetical protein J2S98_004199 [Arthrobacter oryzae]|nr:hypothetical protein [Arthrobacter oryzae]